MLERSDELAELGAAARRTLSGAGAVALIHGEAGIGKSTVVQALRAALPADTRLLVGYCDALSTPRTLGPLKDVAPSLGDAVVASVTSGQRDAVMSALHDALRRAVPTVLVVEDVHWADEATIDALRFVARRIDDLPVLLVLTYRDERDRSQALTGLLGDLGHRQDVIRLPLHRLSLAAVTQLLADADDVTGRARLNPRTVYDLSNGNPYLATELIVSTSDAGLVPPTVVDGVLGRLRLLSSAAQDVVEQLAVIPGSVPRALIDALTSDGWMHVGDAEAKGLLIVSNGVVSFRHELTRLAVSDALSGSRRAELNQAALQVLQARSDADVSQLVHHALAAGDDDALIRHGPAAARHAAASGAHPEAARHYGVVLAHEHRFAPHDRAILWQAYAIELYTIGDGAGCVPAGERAVELFAQVGEPAALSRSQRWLSRLLWLATRPLDARVMAARATSTARTGDDESVLAMALSNEAQLAMLGDDQERALPLARQAIADARRLGDDAVLSHALTNLGTSLFRRDGVTDEARAAFEEAIDVAVRRSDHENACRAYVNVGWSLLEQGELDAAEPFARAGLAYAEKVEFVMFWQYLSGLLARIELARGRWREALVLVARMMPSALPVWTTKLLVCATVAIRRGDADAQRLLREAWEFAARGEELQRTVPVACAALEYAAMAGEEPIVDATRVLRATDGTAFGLQAEELAWRLDSDSVGSHLARSPYSMLAAGRWREAAEEWERLGWPYHRAEALAASPDVDDQLAALEILDDLGAAPLATIVRRRLRDLGGVRVPRGAMAETREDPAGLTGRQQTVLALLAEGHTNPEIAQRLVLSVRTVDSHVAAIFVKLGVTTRRAAAQVARERLPRDLGSSAPKSR